MKMGDVVARPETSRLFYKFLEPVVPIFLKLAIQAEVSTGIISRILPHLFQTLQADIELVIIADQVTQFLSMFCAEKFLHGNLDCLFLGTGSRLFDNFLE